MVLKAHIEFITVMLFTNRKVTSYSKIVQIFKIWELFELLEMRQVLLSLQQYSIKKVFLKLIRLDFYRVTTTRQQKLLIVQHKRTAIK